MLARGIVGDIQRVAVQERHEQSARRPYALGNDAQQLQHHGSDSLPLELRRCQTHGLVTERSDRYQQYNVDTLGAQSRSRLGSSFA